MERGIDGVMEREEIISHINYVYRPIYIIISKMIRSIILLDFLGQWEIYYNGTYHSDIYCLPFVSEWEASCHGLFLLVQLLELKIHCIL